MMSIKKQVVLVVEDDAWLADHIAATLEAANFTAVTARHALQAIEKIDEIKPDVLWLDIMLPGATGFSLLHELQSYRDTASLPVVVCSSLAETLKRDDMMPYGVRRMLDKSTMTPDDIVAAVRSVL